MAREMESIYTSTIGSYKKILGQFNPALENLVYLGNNYLKVLSALSEVAENYYNAIKKIGEQALQNSTCHGLGQVLIQMAESCKSASAGLNVVFQTLHGDIMQQMDKNTKLDMQFIHDSQNRYEMEYRQRAATLDKCMSEAWKMERQRDRNLQNMKEKVNMLHSDMLSFVKESQRAAELEEKRRYRFLAEKHLQLCSSFLQYHTRAHGLFNVRIPTWKEQIDVSRAQTGPVAQAQNYASSRPAQNAPRSVVDVLAMVNRADQNEGRAPADFAKRGLQSTPSNGSLSNFRSRSNSFGEVAVAAVVAASASTGNRKVQAIVDHNTKGNRTMLQFSKGDMITVMVPEARNGWLYGRVDSLATTGWFPEAYVKSLDASQDSRSPPLRSAHSASDLLDDNVRQPANRNSQRGNVANAAPPPPNNNSIKKAPQGLRELFPRGTNPFATVKLRPTVTDDRSAPVLR
ncbi:PREDICTED: brain-specific angiogenesis inhibitor 1-associated protein 2-like protein 2 [Nanorana parkeri]|uniref:brain-specific angiogenesis inhibitor 1-associated protein 2-like protein 2 n=1 Tax=Nanorana parkeri TaxID=125878 RepID=UPI000854D20B|nr:PREDICTED: brain-specific angiogenesis inhibitor 1-associated protein 2-like protein 2 [Nanorana parkeri]